MVPKNTTTCVCTTDSGLLYVVRQHVSPALARYASINAHMEALPNSITITIAVLTAFLSFITAAKYAIEDDFVRTRLIMTAFFFFIVATITVSFWRYTFDTLPYTTPAWLAGAALGYLLGVRTEQAKLRMQGLQYYMEHFAHIHVRDLQGLNWWTVINFYSVMGALVMINLIGLSTVLFPQVESLAIATSVVGAFLLGTIAPYLLHLWSIRVGRQH